MKKMTALVSLLIVLLLVVGGFVVLNQNDQAPAPASASNELSLITHTPEEGFAVAVRLARLGVTETQQNRDVLHALRPGYAHDAEALIAASHVVAVHFQTVAAANNYWR